MVKRVIKGLLNKLGYDIVPHIETPSCPFDVLELVIEAQLARESNFYFLQIGANDGVRNDPIGRIVLRHKLPGLLVEPLPDLFTRLQKNYAGQPGLAFECCAVGNEDGEATLYRVRPNPSMPEWVQGIASFNRSHISKFTSNVDNLEKFIEPIKVPILSLSSLLRKHNISDVTLLQVDTEGWDCRIVAAAMKDGLRPQIIHYEYVHCSPKERADCKRLLETSGYRFIDVGRDTLAVHTDS